MTSSDFVGCKLAANPDYSKLVGAGSATSEKAVTMYEAPEGKAVTGPVLTRQWMPSGWLHGW